MTAMEKLVESLSRAIYRNEVFGVIYDNDPDGVYSCILLTTLMKNLGCTNIDIFPANHAYSIDMMIDSAHRNITQHFPGTKTYNIVILDLTIKAEDIIHHLYESKNTRVMAIDHHKQSKEEEACIRLSLKRYGDKDIFSSHIDVDGENSTTSLTSAVVMDVLRYCDKEKYFAIHDNVFELYKKHSHIANLITTVDTWKITSDMILEGNSPAIYLDCHVRKFFEQMNPQMAYQAFSRVIDDILTASLNSHQDTTYSPEKIDNYILVRFTPDYYEMMVECPNNTKDTPIYSEYGHFFFMEVGCKYQYVNYAACLLLAKHPEINAVAFVVEDRPTKISLRSRKSDISINVGELAKKLGGGGHDQAGGFRITAVEYLEKVKLKKKDDETTIFFTPSKARVNFS